MSDDAAESPTIEWSRHQYFYSLGPIFNAEEAARIIGEAASLGAHQGTLTAADGRQIRNATLYWLPNSQNTSWVFGRLSQYVRAWNQGFGLDLSEDPPRHGQLTR